MKANEIIKVLGQFKDSSYKNILIDGEWGIGKTKYISDFMKDHSNACYVSLFGKKDVNTIIQEIYFQILDKAPQGKIKKFTSMVRQKMNTLDISYFGVSLSIPVIQNMFRTLNKELSEKDTFIIVFDDLERKHDELDIKEIFGIVDSLSKINNIKIVLVAAVDHIKNDKENFMNYKEKAIDRIYTIKEYAAEAPMKIMGEQVWKVIGPIADSFEFKNLRTFEKTNYFIKEVALTLGEEIFTEKFTRDDLYRMCFATVFFNIEHKGEMVLLDAKETHSDLMNIYYTTEKSGVILYMCNLILKNSLENDMCKNVLPEIKEWYESGTYSKRDIIDLISSINNYKEKPLNFYSSETEIRNMINNTRKYLRNLSGTEQIQEIIAYLSSTITWCEILSVDLGISNEEILNLIRTNISLQIDITKDWYQDPWDFPTENDKARNLINLINERLKSEYFIQLSLKIKNLFQQKSYHENSYLKHLIESIFSVSEESIRKNILRDLNDNYYYFPIPTGQITEQQWTWCRNIKNLIREIEMHWGVENYFNDFKSYVGSCEMTETDKMLQHRLKLLFARK
ncbi:P-loop NTPase fold protein [Paenibacillus sp. FSL M7-0134]|uniref:P-loop NTPase fold protein n=1 Tax=Paenibacillus sp. FSL M7-0134 TaxID=2954754 RepID=UPI0030F56EFC